MAYLKLKNRKDFVSNFLSPVSNLNDQCVIKLTSDKLTCILASSDATIVCKADIDIESDVTGEVNLNIPDIKKFVRVLEILSDENIELKLNNNNLSFNNGDYKFKYHLLDDGIVKQPAINIEKVNSLDFDTEFDVKESNFTTLFKGSSFASETSKLYFYEEDGKIFGELGDKTRHNTDNFVCSIANEYEGNALPKALPVNFESFRLLSFAYSNKIHFKINTKMGVITCSFKKGNVDLIYVISALIN
jgi:hypothetical protein|tara:strand:+ start:1016 stop:1753 length:738 start_codon:yes stop_codon:yes gene_type:complete